jgi:hypothetical protein
MAKLAAFGTQLTMGIRQVETATVVGTITGSGNATVVTTASGMTGSPITTSVAVLNGDSATAVATKIRTALNLVANITAKFDVGGSGVQVVLTRLIAAANDATLNISIDNDTCSGLTTAATSADTITGVNYAVIAQVSNLGGPGLALDTEDVTTHDSPNGWEEVVATILRTGEMSLDIVYDPNGATHSASAGGLLYKLKNKQLSYHQLIWPGAYTWTFSAFVTGFEPGAPHDGALTAAVKMKITGAPVLV